MRRPLLPAALASVALLAFTAYSPEHPSLVEENKGLVRRAHDGVRG